MEDKLITNSQLPINFQYSSWACRRIQFSIFNVTRALSKGSPYHLHRYLVCGTVLHCAPFCLSRRIELTSRTRSYHSQQTLSHRLPQIMVRNCLALRCAYVDLWHFSDVYGVWVRYSRLALAENFLRRSLNGLSRNLPQDIYKLSEK